MDLTLGIICSLLSGAYDVVANFPPDEDYLVSEWRIHNGEKPEPDVLYLVNESIPDNRVWRGRLAIGLREPPEIFPEGCRYLYVREKRAKDRSRSDMKRFLDLANALQSVLRRFDKWVLRMERELNEEADLAELLQSCEREMGFVSLLVNRNLRYLAVSDSFAATNPWYRHSTASMDFNMLNELMADEAFQRAIEQHSAFYYHYDGLGAADDSACFNVFVDSRYEARLLVQSPSGNKAYGQLAVTKMLGRFVKDVMEGYAGRRETRFEDPAFSDAVASLLNAPPTRIDDVRKRLELRGWAMEHRYRVHVFRFMQPESETVTRRYYEGSIARLFVGCCVVSEGDLTCCVRNLTLEGMRADAGQQDLVLFLRENLCWAGTSEDFKGIASLSAHYEEAKSALRLGLKAKSTEWHFQFQDYTLDHVLDRAVDGIGHDSLFHPAYTALHEHDHAHGTHLLETAECFMECKYNVTHAADALGIHRSSMLSRLDRIREVSGFDWDDRDERLLLALTFALVGRASARPGSARK